MLLFNNAQEVAGEPTEHGKLGQLGQTGQHGHKLQLLHIGPLLKERGGQQPHPSGGGVQKHNQKIVFGATSTPCECQA